MKKYLPTFEKGFTLIELMVVVTIIAFLSVIGIVAFSNAQAQARDGRRRADIDAIATAMEANRTGTPGSEAYPAYAGSIFANSQKPYDPLDTNKTYTAVPYNGQNYDYTVSPGTAAASTYVACAILEKGNGNACDTSFTLPTGSPPTCSGGTPVNFYCRKNQQ